jgi:hypothetical protein
MVFINVMVFAIGQIGRGVQKSWENDAGDRRERGAATLYSRYFGSITTAFSKKDDNTMLQSVALKHGVFLMRHSIPVCQLWWRI